MTISVVKAGGTTQPFDREKVLDTCLRLGANQREAELVAKKIESIVYDGIETRKILQIIFKELGKHKPAVRCQICLRRALSLMKPKPDFERFVQILLREQGYDVVPNQVVRGRCVEHEVDAVATREGETCIVEVKHHYNHHTQTGLDVARIARAVFEDVTEGSKLGLNEMKIDRAMIVSNTKLSEHAKRYARCRQIRHIGWSSPSNQGLQDMIEETELYPTTYLKGLKTATRQKLASAGIILLKQLVTKKLEKLERETGIPKGILQSAIKKAKTTLSMQQ